jgi:hypothetical protein
MNIRKKNAQRVAEFISYNETLTQLEKILDEPLKEIATWLKGEKFHLNDAVARWSCTAITITKDDESRHECLGRLLGRTITTGEIPGVCGLDYAEWGPNNVGWQRAELQKLLHSHELNVTLYPPLPGFEPKPPVINALEEWIRADSKHKDATQQPVVDIGSPKSCSQKASAAANKRHGKPGMSPSTARKALINTPDP